MSKLSPTTPIGFALLVLAGRRDRSRDERGASAVEWIIIAAIVVGVCGAIAAILVPALTGEAGEIANEIQKQ
jgi:Flp pilus assembly pilin Flp